MGIEVGGLLGLIWLVIVVWAIVKVAKSSAGGLAKLLWIIEHREKPRTSSARLDSEGRESAPSPASIVAQYTA
ncbi:MAG: hypothetical protein GBQ79_12685 [Halomonas sp.]|nr:hypothetical protein [Halomonas sp.]